jgi:hypothetical protein
VTALKSQNESSKFAWPPSFAGMAALTPASVDLVEHDRTHAPEYNALADSLKIPRFSATFRDELTRFLGGRENAALFEAVARVGCYCDSKEHTFRRNALSKSLKKDGISLPRGKRSAPGVLELVADLTPMLLYFSVCYGTGEYSRLPDILRNVAIELGMDDDPRNELRRLNKLKKAREIAIKTAIVASVKKGLKSLKTHNPH